MWYATYISKIYGCKRRKELAKSRKTAIVGTLSLAVACIIGVIGRAYLYPTVLSTEGSQYEMYI